MSWVPVVVVLLMLCSYSVYYNIFNGAGDPFSLVKKDQLLPGEISHKEAVCVALRDRLLNVHKQGFLPSGSPVQQYWDELNCVAMNLPPIQHQVEGANAVHSEPLISLKSDQRVVDRLEVNPHSSAATIPPAPLAPSPAPLGTSADAVERNGPFKECTRMLKKYHVRVDIDWGSLPLQLQRTWKSLDCDNFIDESLSFSPEELQDATVEVVDLSIKSPEGIRNTLQEESASALEHKRVRSCRRMKTMYNVVPGTSWGTLDAEMQLEWSRLQCKNVFKTVELPLSEAEADSSAKLKKGKSSNKYTDADWCIETKKKYNVIPMTSWGQLPMNMVDSWKSKHCDVVFTKLRMGKSKIATCNSTKQKLPLIAVMAATTSRKMQNPSIKMMSLFNYLLPSLVRSLDCGFEYLFVLGYDKGDPFYDNDEGLNSVKEWFDKNVKKVLSEHGINIRLLPVKINNSIKKPGPVFIGMAREAYNAGADYYYRLNDDTEIVGHWPKAFVNALNTLTPPYGVVGPTCKQGNTGILTHDFVHRTHMEIFEMNYYPPELVDWWMDDWISVVYGYKRTFEGKQSPVVHHTGAHGQRYEVNKENFKMLSGLVEDGRQRIRKWMLQHNSSSAELKEFNEDNFSFKVRRSAPQIRDEDL